MIPRHFLDENVAECPGCRSAALSPATHGNRTGKWFRQCRACGATLVIATMPEEPPRVINGPAVVPLPLTPDPQPTVAPVQGRFDRFELPSNVSAAMAEAKKQVAGQQR